MRELERMWKRRGLWWKGKQRDEQTGKTDREKERAWWMGRQKMR